MSELSEMGSKIKRLREENNLTQKELGEQINVSDKTISKWECGKGYPDITILPVLAKSLQVNTGYFFSESDKNMETYDNSYEEILQENFGMSYGEKIEKKLDAHKGVKLVIEIILGALLLAIILMYNHIRIFGNYSFGFLFKDYSVNLIPLKYFSQAISLLGIFAIGKSIIAMAMGVLLETILFIAQKRKTSSYIVASLATILCMTLLKMYTSGFEPITIDSNSFLFYVLGFALGYLFVWCVCKGLYYSTGAEKQGKQALLAKK